MTATAQLKFSYVKTNGVTLHVAEAGPQDGPLLILLHGFPEFWYGWRHQIALLTEAGFHVIVPDQRGYTLSDKPKGWAAYTLDQLAGDVIGLADHYGAERFYLAGHDWGAAVGWWTAQNFPNRVRRFIALSAGHPAAWRAGMESDPEQKRKSRYVKLFALPWLPEALMRARNFKGLADGIRATARSDAVSDADLARYRQAWGQPGALTAGLNWYRALLKTPLEAPGAYRVAVPTLMIWGRQDPFGSLSVAEKSVMLCDQGTLSVFDEATHWTLADEPVRVAQAMLEFFRD